MMSTAQLALPTKWRSDTVESHYQDVARVITEMRLHLAENLSLEQLADIAIMTPFHFNRVFRCVTGIPPCRFLWMMRLEEAKSLLLTTSRSITEICYDVGYNSLGTFTRRFTQLVGLPPLQFRRLNPDQINRSLTVERPSTKTPHLKATRQKLGGEVRGPRNFIGRIAIGLYSSPVPYEKPLACTLAAANGSFSFCDIPRGRLFCCAAAIRESQDRLDALLSQRILRGRSLCPSLGVPEAISSRLEGITLRAPSVTDPPLLLCLPYLMQRGAAN